MKKIKSLPKHKLDEIASLIGESFWEYPYEKGEGALKELVPSRRAMDEYMRALVVAGIESGNFYCTDGGEGYILLTDSNGSHPGFCSIWRMTRSIKKALGGWGKLITFFKKATAGGESLEKKMKKRKQPFVKVEMLVVTKEYQGKGYMRKLLEFAYRMADEKSCVCILDTDAKGKCDRYIHLGMKPVQTRQTAGFKIYDLIRKPTKERGIGNETA